jgi:hypothetical protein
LLLALQLLLLCHCPPSLCQSLAPQLLLLVVPVHLAPASQFPLAAAWSHQQLATVAAWRRQHGRVSASPTLLVSPLLLLLLLS